MNNSSSFFRKFTKIKGENPISSIRRLPWRNKIRLGIQIPTIEKDKEGKYKLDSKGNPIQKRDKFGGLEFHPKDVPYFVCPVEVQKIFEKEPTELNIAFPLSGLDENGFPDIGGIFPQAYKYYGSSRGLKCVGDGETAMKANEEGIFEEVDCPCDKFGQKDGCSKRASLLFFIPSISLGGIYVIDSGSWNTMVDVQSGIYLALELLKDSITGRYNSITMLPFKLRRIQKETQHEKRKDKHWPLTCELDLTIPEIKKIREGQTLFYGQKRIYQIEDRPEDVNPAYDSKEDGAVIEEETEEETKAREAKDIADKEAVKKDIEESKTREADLKKAKEVGKTALRTPEKIRKLLEKRNAILDEIQTVARAYKVNTWREIVDIGERWNIFPKGLVASQVKQIVVDHPDKLKALLVAIKSDMEIADEDIPDRVGKLEVKNEEAPYPDERDEAEDFINDSDIPDLL
uniref:Uncharacterized protein n=1 Tax=viral metagenome TaxID=1070528 RepID=A0A6M3XJP9_9ZZZZ